MRERLVNNVSRYVRVGITLGGGPRVQQGPLQVQPLDITVFNGLPFVHVILQLAVMDSAHVVGHLQNVQREGAADDNGGGGGGGHEHECEGTARHAAGRRTGSNDGYRLLFNFDDGQVSGTQACAHFNTVDVMQWLRADFDAALCRHVAAGGRARDADQSGHGGGTHVAHKLTDVFPLSFVGHRRVTLGSLPPLSHLRKESAFKVCVANDVGALAVNIANFVVGRCVILIGDRRCGVGRASNDVTGSTFVVSTPVSASYSGSSINFGT